MTTFTPATTIERAPLKGTMAEAGASSADLWVVYPKNLRRLPGFNIRDKTQAYTDHVNDLAALIRANGYDRSQPMKGFTGVDPESGENVIFITDGHHRLDALEILMGEGWNEPVTVVPRNQDPKVREVSLLELSKDLLSTDIKRNLTLHEKSQLALRFEGTYTRQEVADLMHVSRTHVDDLMLLAMAPIEIRQFVIDGKASGTLVIDMLREKSYDQVLAELREAAEGGGKVTKKKVKAKAEDGGDGEGGEYRPRFAFDAEAVHRQAVKNGSSEYADALWWVLGQENPCQGPDDE